MSSSRLDRSCTISDQASDDAKGDPMDTVATDKAPAKRSGWAKQLIAFGLAAALLYFSFKGCDFGQIWAYAKTTNPTFILLVCITCVLSHLLRAWRWIYLLEPVSQRKISLWNSFCAVI